MYHGTVHTLFSFTHAMAAEIAKDLKAIEKLVESIANDVRDGKKIQEQLGQVQVGQRASRPAGLRFARQIETAISTIEKTTAAVAKLEDAAAGKVRLPSRQASCHAHHGRLPRPLLFAIDFGGPAGTT